MRNMKKHKISKVVWFDETEERLPELYLAHFGKSEVVGLINSDELFISCSKRKPKQNAKKIRITIEEV